ncbi:MAG: hypothetical protein WC593_15030 [Methanoregula sp.]
MADNYNFLSNYYRPQPRTDIVDSLGRGVQLGQNIANIPYENSLRQEKLAELERMKQSRNAMSEYGKSGDINPLMQVAPEKAFELQDKQAALELKKAGVSEKNMELGIDAITKLSPLINDQNYAQMKGKIDGLFGTNVMPDKYNPVALKQVSDFALRAKEKSPSWVYDATKGNFIQAPGAGTVSVVRPYKTPEQELDLATRKEGMKFNFKKQFEDYKGGKEGGRQTGELKMYVDTLKEFGESPDGPNGKYSEEQIGKMRDFYTKNKKDPASQVTQKAHAAAMSELKAGGEYNSSDSQTKARMFKEAMDRHEALLNRGSKGNKVSKRLQDMTTEELQALKNQMQGQ